MLKPAILALADGSIFRGWSLGIDGESVGEVVFNTALTGYQEILTDPSYAQQMVTLTYPHIGNTGVNPDDWESARIFAAGLIVRDCPPHHSNWRATKSLPAFLQEHGVVAIGGIDTRRLTRLLRDKGAQNGCILAGQVDDALALQKARAFPGLINCDLAQVVSTPHIYEWCEASWQHGVSSHVDSSALPYHVVAYDFGVKHAILRQLVDRGCRVTVVPAKTSADAVLGLKPDGIFLSNGPGDPAPCDYAINAIKTLLKSKIPLFGICLGHQLLALASGIDTVKMKFGHHGANHPVQNLETGVVFISSQNHGFAVSDAKLPPTVKVTYRSLFDGSIQGLRRTDCPAFSFQGHPEAGPGPHDVSLLFDEFVQQMQHANAQKEQSHSPQLSAAKEPYA